MSSGTFGYPLCFAAMFAVIGLMVSPRSDVGGLASNDAGPATIRKREATATKAPLNPRIAAELIERCEEFIRKYPDSKHFEHVAMFAGETRAQRGLEDDWREVGKIFRDLEIKYPKSESLDRYVFFQALAFFHDAKFAESTPLLDRSLEQFPNSTLMENALYYLAMSNFLSNKYKETLASCRDFLAKFPDGPFAGDMHYRLAFIDFNNKEEDQSDKIIRDLGGFLAEHPDDAANGGMYCLMADTYKRMEKFDEALDSYIKAVDTDSPDDVLQYALDSATVILQERKDWSGIAKLHGDFMQRKPDSPLALMSVTWVAKMMAREGKGAEAAEILARSLKTRITDPSSEQVDLIIDELVKTLVPRKKPRDIDANALDKQLMEILNKTIGGMENPTTTARVCYARARLAKLLRRNDRSDLYLKGIANFHARDPSALSPTLLAVCGDVLLKSGDLEGAEAMFQRLNDHYPEAACGDAGPVGLGHAALARNTPGIALGVFEQALKKPENRRFNEATVGKLEALVDLDQLETAEKLAVKIVGDRKFRGELAAKAYLQLVRIYRKQAAKAEGENSRDLLKKAHGYCQRVYVAYQAYPDLCAEGYWQAAEVAGDLGEEKLRQDTLKALLENPKLKNTEAFKKAMQLK